MLPESQQAKAALAGHRTPPSPPASVLAGSSPRIRAALAPSGHHTELLGAAFESSPLVWQCLAWAHRPSGHHVLPRLHSPRCSPWQVLQAGGDPAATWLIPHHTRGQRCQTRAGCSQTSHLCSRAKGWDKRVPDLVVDAAACRPSSFPTPSSQHSRMEEKHEEPKTHATTESAFITGPLNLLVYFLFTTSGTEAHDCSQRGSCVSHTFTDFSNQELLIYPFLCTHFFEYLYQALQHWSHSHRNQHNLQCLTAARPQP